MRAAEFRDVLPVAVRAQLPEALQRFQHRSRFSLVQFWYDEPAFHFEVWPQARYEVVEIGLHLEHPDAQRNAALHAFFDGCLVEIRHELGEMWLERWDRGWHKLYKTLPLRPYSAALLAEVAREAARQMAVLQPLLAEALRRAGR